MSGRVDPWPPIILSVTFCVTTMPPPGERPPLLIVDSDNIDYDLARQYARAGGLVRRRYAGPTGVSLVEQPWWCRCGWGRHPP